MGRMKGTSTNLARVRATQLAQNMISGGGNVSFSTARRLKWNSRFIAIAGGTGPHASSTGHYNFNPPATGTVIPVYGDPGSTTSTVTADGVLLPTWSALYGIPTPGGNESAVSYAIVQYTNPFVVPDHWVLLAVSNEDANGGPSVRLASGEVVLTWHVVGTAGEPGFTNNWTHFDATNGGRHASFRRTSAGLVVIKGLIRSGTLGAGAFILPTGYRPAARQHYSIMSNNAQGAAWVDPSGEVVPWQGNATWVDLSQLWFQSES